MVDLWKTHIRKTCRAQFGEPSLDVREVHRHEKRAPIGRSPQTLVQTSEVCLEIVLWVCCFTQPGENDSICLWPIVRIFNHPPSCSHKYMYAEHYILTQLMYTDLWLHHDLQPIMNQSSPQTSRPKMQPRCFSPLLNYGSFTAHEWWGTPTQQNPQRYTSLQSDVQD
jgi:hypothetical protein